MDKLGLSSRLMHSLKSSVIDILVNHTWNIPASFARSFIDIVVEMT